MKAQQLAGVAMEEAVRRAGVDNGMISEVIAGDCIQAVDEASAARVAALSIGIPVEVPAYTVVGGGNGDGDAFGTGSLAMAYGT